MSKLKRLFKRSGCQHGQRDKLDGGATAHREANASITNTTFTHCSDVISTGNIYAKGDVNITQKVEASSLDEKTQQIMDITISESKAWTTNMVKTAAFRKIMDKLAAGETWITIIGSPGEGKTTTAYMALYEMHRQEKKIFKLVKPDEYRHITLSCPNPIIMLDDIFGDVIFEEAKLEAWKTVLHQILDAKEHKSHQTEPLKRGVKKVEAVVIMVGRDYILKSASRHLGRLSQLVTHKVIDMSQPFFRSFEEKVSIWNALVKAKGVHLEQSELLELFRINSGHGFPHVCRMFADMHKGGDIKSAVKFFRFPLVFLDQTITNLVENEEILTLFKVVIKKSGKITRDELRNSGCSYKVIQKADDMIGTYLRKKGEYYTFDHPSIYDCVAYKLCELDPLFVIQNCSVSFISQRLRLNSVSDTQYDSNPLVQVPLCYIGNLATRFAAEISNQNFFYVLSHEACTGKRFIEEMMTQISLPLENLLKLEDTTTSQPFIELVPFNKSPELLMYIDNHTDYIGQNIHVKNTLLLAVSKYGALDVLMYMIKKYDKLDPNFTNMSQESPLMLASCTRHSQFVDQMMTLRPNLLARDWNRRTAFHYLCKYGHVSAVRRAIDSGIDVDIEDKMGNTPLDLALQGNHVNVVRLLLDTQLGKTIRGTILMGSEMFFASRWWNGEMVTLFSENDLPVDATEIFASTPLHAFCERNEFESVKSLLDQGADVNVQHHNASTPLHKAVALRNMECVDVLLKAQADVNIQDKSGRTPLYIAACEGFAKCVKALIEAHADTTLQDEKRATPLHVAAEGGHATCVDLLIKAKADVNALDNFGAAPLHLAGAGGHATCVDMLIEAGADVNVQNDFGSTPLHCSTDGNFTECVEMFVKARSNVSLQNMKGYTPLHSAAKEQSVECMDLLVRCGSRLNMADNEGWTPLHYCVYNNLCYNKPSLPKKDLCKLLLDHGADANCQDINGNTPLHVLCDMTIVCDVERSSSPLRSITFKEYHVSYHRDLFQSLVMLLVDNKADVNILNSNGIPALHGWCEDLVTVMK